MDAHDLIVIGTGCFRKNAMIFESLITCPHCGTAKTESMPTDACRVFYECSGCGAKLRPKPGDCCVFCSYGFVPCRRFKPSARVKRAPLTAAPDEGTVASDT